MWIGRELVRLVARVAICFTFALALAAIWAAIGTQSFETDLRRTCLALGCIALLLGGIGRGSNFERAMDAGVAHNFWGRVPGMSTLRSTGEDRTLAPGAVFFLTGIALLALGLFVL
jgi:hypothetical protein